MGQKLWRQPMTDGSLLNMNLSSAFLWELNFQTDQSWSGSAKTKAEFSNCAIVWLDLPTIFLFKVARYPLSQQHRATKVVRPIIKPWPFHPEARAQLIGAHISPILRTEARLFPKGPGSQQGQTLSQEGKD